MLQMTASGGQNSRKRHHIKDQQKHTRKQHPENAVVQESDVDLINPKTESSCTSKSTSVLEVILRSQRSRLVWLWLDSNRSQVVSMLATQVYI